MKENKKITIFVGNYGSGKTEISLNYAINGAKYYPTTLIDLDIVNPYFRSSEKKEELEKLGIKVLMPNFANTAVDVPSLPAAIQSVFSSEDNIIFDVGGDDTGAAALGRYHPYFINSKEKVDVYYVVNTLRPLSMDKESIVDLITRIEARGRLPVTGLIHNTNWAQDTTTEQIINGNTIIQEVCEEKNLPLIATVVTKNIYDSLPDSLRENIWIIERKMRPEWMKDL